jgi:shikimate dehydrogenase
MTRIDASFKVCALLGFPAHHSMGPAIHNTAFEELALPFVYVAHDVAPADLAAAMAGTRALGYRGLSITMPHKVAALDLVDEVDATARAIGCINTVVNDHGRLVGYNSDGQGALDALARAGIAVAGRRVLVLGSGGAARAVAMTVALHGRPAELEILGVVEDELARLGATSATSPPRKPARGSSTTQVLPPRWSGPRSSCTARRLACFPETERTLVPRSLLRPDLAVFDAVYNPRRTLLLKDAAALGCRVVEGMEMFLGQAAVQFELWTGKTGAGWMRCDV